MMTKTCIKDALKFEINGVYHICYHGQKEVQELIKKKENEDKELNKCSFRTFPYIAHFLSTGDLIYPAHEGDDHVSAMLAEMGRLGLLQKLNDTSYSKCTTPLCKSNKNNDGNFELKRIKIRTKDKSKWHISESLSRILKRRKSDVTKYQVYRPPVCRNKGSTLVVIQSLNQGNKSLKIFGNSNTLQSIFSESDEVKPLPNQYHLNSFVRPQNFHVQEILEEFRIHGFVTTVKSSRVDKFSSALVTQWILYRNVTKKILSPGIITKRTSISGTIKNAMKSPHSSNNKIIPNKCQQNILPNKLEKSPSLMFNDTIKRSRLKVNNHSINNLNEFFNKKSNRNSIGDSSSSSNSDNRSISSSSTSTSFKNNFKNFKNSLALRPHNNFSQVLKINNFYEETTAVDNAKDLKRRTAEYSDLFQQYMESKNKINIISLPRKSASTVEITSAVIMENAEENIYPSPSLKNVNHKTSMKKLFTVFL